MSLDYNKKNITLAKNLRKNATPPRSARFPKRPASPLLCSVERAI